MKKEPEENQNKTELSFEESLAKLEKIVNTMEEGKLPLEDMMKNFEEASKLVGLCSAKLKNIEAKIEILVNKNSSNGEWQQFNTDEQKRQDDESTF